MSNRKNLTTNPTLLRLKGTPFKTAADLKASQERILKEEWQSVERARVRWNLLSRDDNRVVIAPLQSGVVAKFVGDDSDSLPQVRVYLGPENTVEVDIDKRFRGNEPAVLLESLVKSLVDGLLSGYLALLGLRESTVRGIKTKSEKAL